MRKLIFAAFALILIGAGCGKPTPTQSGATSPTPSAQPQALGNKLDLSQPNIVCTLLSKEDVQTTTGIPITETNSTSTDCSYNTQRQLDLPVITLKADQTIKWEPDDFDYDKESATELGMPMIEVSNLGKRALYWDIQGSKNNISPNIRWIKNETRFTIITFGLEDYGFNTEQKRKEVLIKLAKIVDRN